MAIELTDSDRAEIIAAVKAWNRERWSGESAEDLSPHGHIYLAGIRAGLERAAKVKTALTLAMEQAENEGLWFVAGYISENYLQLALRELHAAVESDAAAIRALAKP